MTAGINVPGPKEACMSSIPSLPSALLGAIVAIALAVGVHFKWSSADTVIEFRTHHPAFELLRPSLH